MQKMVYGVMECLNLSHEQKNKIIDNIIFKDESGKTKDELMKYVATPLLEKYKPDMLIIDPALAFRLLPLI